MSRYSITKGNKQLVYGHDHALGYFYDITDLSEDEDSPKHLIEEKSYFINGLSRNQFANILKNPYECYYEGVYGNFMLGFELASKGGVLCFH